MEGLENIIHPDDGNADAADSHGFEVSFSDIFENRTRNEVLLPQVNGVFYSFEMRITGEDLCALP